MSVAAQPRRVGAPTGVARRVLKLGLGLMLGYAGAAPPAQAFVILRGGVGGETFLRAGFEQAPGKASLALGLHADVPTSNSLQHAFVGARGWWGDTAGWGAGVIAGPEVSWRYVDANLGVGLGVSRGDGTAIWSGLSLIARPIEFRWFSAGVGVHALWAVAPRIDAFGSLAATLVLSTR